MITNLYEITLGEVWRCENQIKNIHSEVNDVIAFLSTPIDGTSLYLKISIKRFHETMASGKKLFMYPFDLHIIV